MHDRRCFGRNPTESITLKIRSFRILAVRCEQPQGIMPLPPKTTGNGRGLGKIWEFPQERLLQQSMQTTRIDGNKKLIRGPKTSMMPHSQIRRRDQGRLNSERQTTL